MMYTDCLEKRRVGLGKSEALRKWETVVAPALSTVNN
jgi:hypothetical protein